MKTDDLYLKDRVRLNERGRVLFKKGHSRTGAVVSLPKPGGGSVGVLFDGNKQPTRIHRTCLELVKRTQDETA
jgi:hypothetical protein